MADRFLGCHIDTKIWKQTCDQMINNLLNSIVAKYRVFLVSRRSVICLSLQFQQTRVTDLLTTDKSQCIADLVQ